ncbi:MAG: nucleotidyltransferase family protein [Deltaproteobacteria bacterium]|nr:nucleotidyltransferase family protein [Deltaproteobacteria bacterium]
MSAQTTRTAVVLAAGLGTRLRPLSNQVPKPLFPIANRPLLGIILEQLIASGFRRLAINTHHRADDLRDFVESHRPAGVEVVVSYEPEILGTGGGLRQLAGFLGDKPFLVINGDIITDLNLARAYRRHRPEALATMILHDYPRFNNVWLDPAANPAAFGGARPSHCLAAPLAFTGIQVVSPRIFALMSSGVYVDIINIYRQAIASGGMVAGAVEQGFFWRDIGTPQDYLEIHRLLLAGRVPGLAPLFPNLSDPCVSPGAVLEEGVCCAGGVTVGPGGRVGRGAHLKNTVIWAGTIIAPQVRLEDCLVGQGVRVRESARGRCFSS